MILNEEVAGDKIYLYTSSKDSEYYKYFFNKELRYGNNAGLNYGAGIYSLLYTPENEEANITYKLKTRENLYGNYLYKLELDTDNILFLIYREFIKTPLYKRLQSNEETYITDQLQHFGIKMPSKDVLDKLNMPVVKSNSPAALALFKYLNKIYYQNSDGSLNSPIDGFIYLGGNDGVTGVIWNAYSAIPIAISNNNGKSFKKIKSSDPLFKKYIQSIRPGFDEEKHNDNISRIFRGDYNSKKEEAYRLLTSYEADNGRFLGNFYNIVINNDKTIDATYKSNLPQLDDFEHYYRPYESKQLKQLAELGFKLGTLNCGIKFGAEKNKESLPNKYNEYLLPQKVTKGIKFVNLDINGLYGWKERIGENKVILCDCNVLSNRDLKDMKIILTKKPSTFSDDMSKLDIDNKLQEELLTFNDIYKLNESKENVFYFLGRKNEFKNNIDLINAIKSYIYTDLNNNKTELESLTDDKNKINWFTTDCNYDNDNEGYKVYYSKGQVKPLKHMTTWYQIDDEVLYDHDLNYDWNIQQYKGIVQYHVNKSLYHEYLKSRGFSIKGVTKTPSKGDIILDNCGNIAKDDVNKKVFFNVMANEWSELKNILEKEKFNEPYSIGDADAIRIKYKNVWLGFRPTGGKGKTLGNYFEEKLFKVLYIGSENTYISKENKTEQDLINEALSDNEDIDFCREVYNKLKTVIIEVFGIHNPTIKLQSPRIYFTAQNDKNTQLESKFKEWSDITIKSMPYFRNEKDAPSSNKQYYGSINSVNLMKKSDIIVSYHSNKRTIYIPISVKKDEVSGNNGQRSQYFWTTFLAGKRLDDIGKNDFIEFMNTVQDSNAARYQYDNGKKEGRIINGKEKLKNILIDYIGDSGMIYAYADGDINARSVRYQFKVPIDIIAKNISCKEKNPNKSVIFEMFVGSKKVIFSDDGHNKGTVSVKLSTKLSELLKSETSIIYNRSYELKLTSKKESILSFEDIFNLSKI